MLSFTWVGINGWVNNRKVGDLRRYRTHYDVTVMSPGPITWRRYKPALQIFAMWNYIHVASVKFPATAFHLSQVPSGDQHYVNPWFSVVDQYFVVNRLRPRQNRRHFADDIFKCIFLNENARISLKISLKFVPKVRINNIPALVQIMAWRRPGDKPLSEPMMVSLLTHICVIRPQWVKIEHDHVCPSSLHWRHNEHLGVSNNRRQAVIETNAGGKFLPWIKPTKSVAF